MKRRQEKRSYFGQILACHQPRSTLFSLKNRFIVAGEPRKSNTHTREKIRVRLFQYLPVLQWTKPFFQQLCSKVEVYVPAVALSRRLDTFSAVNIFPICQARLVQLTDSCHVQRLN